jgi:hypothetical protein
VTLESRSLLVALSALLLGAAAVPQDEAVMLTALRSRATMTQAMIVAAREMGATAEGVISGDTWRSGMIVVHRQVRSRQNDIVDVSISAVVSASMRGNPPDSVHVTFRAQVSTSFPISIAERSASTGALLTEMAVRTNRALSLDPNH